MSESIWTRPVGSGSAWKHAKVLEMTGEQLAAAVRSGVLRAAGVLTLVGLLGWLVIALIQAS